MRCPFCKSTFYEVAEDSGRGYAYSSKTEEVFQECIGNECMAYVEVMRYPTGATKASHEYKCGLANGDWHTED